MNAQELTDKYINLEARIIELEKTIRYMEDRIRLAELKLGDLSIDVEQLERAKR